MERLKPPFRADHVGSLLRTAALKDAREKHACGEIGADALTAVEDREIEALIKKQEAIGLKVVTDGEFRRRSWNFDFLERLPGVECYLGERKIKFNAKGPQPPSYLLRVTDKLGGTAPHPMVEHFRFLQDHAKATAKVTIPSPSSLHFRYGRDAVPESIYPVMEDSSRILPQSRARLCRRRLPIPAARRGEPGLSVRPVAAPTYNSAR
jgi:5-methyltetrahydropteroyltriglutamate--homocysteine methyltransferase